MSDPLEGFTLNERLGLLRAVCEQNGFFTAVDVVGLELPIEEAVERYGEKGVPTYGAVVFQNWGGQPIVAGMLPRPARSAALPFVRYAAVAQQSLGAKAVDMLIVLIGPDGSSDEADWARAAAAIEDDDRICRKLVWLPNCDVAASAEQFLTRSPFARPWRGALTMEAQAETLDSLMGDEDILDAIAVRADQSGASPQAFVKEALSSARAT